MIYNKTAGLIAAPYAPLDHLGQVRIEVIQEYARFLKMRGIQGVFVNGSTGETSSLTAKEKMQITREWLNYQDENFRVFVHVGSNSVEEAQEMATHAEANNAFAIAATGPSYFKPASVGHLIEIMQSIASAAPKTGFYYYHIPALNQNNLSALEFLDQAVLKIPSLSGMKYTFEDLMEFQLCRQIANGQLDILFGRDEILLCGLTLGAVGAVGSTYNFMPELYQNLIEAFQRGDLKNANDLQVKSMKIIQQYSKYNGIPAGKAIMKKMGLDLGPPRLPFKSLTFQEEKDLFKVLDKLGL